MLNKSSYAIRIKTLWHETLSYFDLYGNPASKSSDASYSLYDMTLETEYGLGPRLSLGGYVRLRTISSQTAQFVANRTGAESARLFVKYAFPRYQNQFFAIGLRYGQSFYTNSFYAPNVTLPQSPLALGDDGSEYGIDLMYAYLAKSFRFDFKLAYNNPPNQLSRETTIDARLLYDLGKFILGPTIQSNISFNDDEFKDAPQLKGKIVAGQTLMFNSINRSWLKPGFTIGYDFKTFNLLLNYSQTIKGKSTDKAQLISLNLNFTTEGETEEKKIVEKFKDYLFEGSVTAISSSQKVKIDQGLNADVEKGMKVDFYIVDYFGGNILIAQGIVESVGSDFSMVKIHRRITEDEIKVGLQVRGR